MASIPQPEQDQLRQALTQSCVVVSTAVGSVKRGAKQLVLTHALAAFVGTTLATAFVLGLADYLLHFPDRGLRTLATLAFVVIASWSLWRFVIPALRVRFSEIEVAQQIERRFPEVAGRLTSAFAFISDDHDRLDSEQLRQSIVQEAADQLDSIDVGDCLDRKATKRVSAATISLLVVVTIMCALDMQSTAIAARRLMMPWKAIAWSPEELPIEPIDIVQLTTIIEPPSYSGIKRYEHAGGPLTALQGSKPLFTGYLARRGRGVTFVNETPAGRTTVPANMDQRHTMFTLLDITASSEWTESGAFWFDVIDEQGRVTRGQMRTDFEVFVDQPPTVSVLAPHDGVSVTPDAVLPIQIEVTDDLAIRSIELQTGGRTVELFRGAVDPPSRTSWRDGHTLSVAHDLNIRELGAAPAEEIEFVVIATDYLSQEGSSTTQTLSIVSQDDLAKQLDRQLREALKVQREARERVDNAKPTAAAIRQVQLRQQQVGRLLLEEPDGATAVLARLRLGNPDDGRLNAVATELTRLEQTSLAALETNFSRLANQLANANEASATDVASQLEVIAASQDEVVATLERLVEARSVFEALRDARRSLADVLDQQGAISQATAGLTTIGQDRSDLSAEDRALLAELAARQQGLARQTSRAHADLLRLGDRVSADAALAEAVAAISQRLSEANLAEQMRSAGRDIGQNRIGRATSAQQAIEEALRDIVDATGDGTAASDQVLADLRRLAEATTQLLEAQVVLLTETADADERQSTQLASQQQTLAERSGELMASVESMRAFAFTLGTAQRSMTQAAEQIKEGEYTGAVAEQRRAVDVLQQILDALSAGRTADRAERPGAENEPSAAGGQAGLQQLRLLRTLQAEMNRRTEALHDKERRGELDQTALDEIAAMADRESELAEIVFELIGDEPSARPEENLPRDAEKSVANQLLDDLEPSPTPALNQAAEGEDIGEDAQTAALRVIGIRMNSVATRLRNRHIAQQTQELQRLILADLDRVLGELEQQVAQSQARPGEPQTAPGAGAGQSSTEPGAEEAHGAGATDIVDPRALFDAMWGRLPEHEREQLQSTLPTEFLPEYAEVIRQYYRRLAEEQRRREGNE